MIDFTDASSNEGAEPYNHAEKMADLRRAHKHLGMKSMTTNVIEAHKLWWQGQTDLATAEELLSMMATKGEEATEIIANLNVRARPNLGDATALCAKLEGRAKSLADERLVVLREQLDYRRKGETAIDERDYNVAALNCAMEYIAYVKARGLMHLIRYYTYNEHRPKVRDDV